MGTNQHKKASAPKWLRHRHLIATEGVLLVGTLNELLQRQVAASALPNWGKVLFIMAVVAGVLGGVLYVVQTFVIKGVAQTHRVAQSLPIPAPALLVHVVVFFGLFLLYAIVWRIPVELPYIGIVGGK
ncbi:MAG: hypothetical protein H0V44_14210 [Planctomycetes bacterium]|nr:hypothetical protein [Planctomycetota bacterium]